MKLTADENCPLAFSVYFIHNCIDTNFSKGWCKMEWCPSNFILWIDLGSIFNQNFGALTWSVKGSVMKGSFFVKVCSIDPGAVLWGHSNNKWHFFGTFLTPHPHAHTLWVSRIIWMAPFANFINILRVAFLPIYLWQKIHTVCTFTQKAAHKMFVKLSPVVNFINILWATCLPI